MITLKRRHNVVWARKSVRGILNIGCGNSRNEDEINLDIKDLAQDIIWDVRHGIPFPDNTLKVVKMYHFLEHLADHDVDDLFWEILRVCRHEATIDIRCPHADTPDAYYAAHCSLWHEARIVGLCKGYNPPWRFVVLSNERVGDELRAELEVRKDAAVDN